MAFGSIELTTITRTQDYTTIKQNEDNKGMLDQVNIGHQVQKQSDQRTNRITQNENAQWHNQKPDAKEKGKNEYRGDGGQKRQKREQKDQVVVKGYHGFDMKI